MTLSNLPPGGGFYAGPEEVPQACANGHKWTATMSMEFGGWYYHDEEGGPTCPVCGEQDILGDCDVLDAIKRFAQPTLNT